MKAEHIVCVQDIHNKKKYIMNALNKSDDLTRILYDIIYQYNCDQGITIRVDLPKFVKEHKAKYGQKRREKVRWPSND